MLDKEKVKGLYLQGYNAVDIAFILNCKSDTVRQCIHRNLKEFKNSHLATKIRNKEIDRITRYEAKQYMSDSTFIKKNRSIYKTNLDGDIVIDVNAAPIVSFDTPKRLKNENSLKEIDKRIRKSNYRKDELFV
ncbi:DNA-binding response regulator [Clostridium sp. YIM B02500]|uniref:DNA-binding response regulator n=1 Tax=Clostridium sp. YIM B02500 TaxID=2910681 RepID=UPI001EEF0390